ncbi:RNA polymerase sigma-70 factor [Sinomicrobium soli]|uniref:RNA polymerase sigma-70 factor n=1 Tax=Sinomicrobium sp. N-1-3-6 TaxID=2219864 RepID=UPI000DCD8BDE|nr:RNA polymerase sigma-70 factor [Sinomicrobium sp. N-1-3-6]RAV31015.1 RNA polymerase sigma-70 factor [Sinomicrobium sp. N-1-3-6]
MNENTAIHRLRKGDEKAFRWLFEVYYADIFLYSRSIVKTEEQAEEITQEVFLKVWLKRSEIVPDKSFRAFLFTIARHFCFNFLKKAASDRLRIADIFYVSQKTEKATDYDLIDEEYMHMGRQAIARLPPKCRLIFNMSREDGKSYRQISEELGISVNTVKFQMNIALKKIRSFLHLHSDILVLLLFFEAF